MRRTLARASISTLLAVSLALAASASASASPVRHTAWFRSAMRNVPARFSLPFTHQLRLPASDAQVLTGLVGSFKVPGSAYHWGFVATTIATQPYLIVFGNQSSANGLQEHEWRFPLPADAFRVGRHLRVAHIHTGSALGTFGQIDLTYDPHGALRTQVLRCPDTHEVIASADVRRGTLTGSFDFASNEGTLPALDVTTMKGRAVREVVTGARCPGQGPTHCYRSSVAVASSTAQGAVIVGSVGGSDLFGSVDQQVAPAEELHFVIASTAGTRVFTMGPNGLNVDASMLAPFASGSLAFDTASTVRHKGPHCRHIVRQRQTWSSGTLTLTMDSGAVDLTGSALKAVVITHER